MGTKSRLAVVGGGVAGVILARRLASSGFYGVELIERGPRLGGLHRSVELDGVAFDIGAFAFDEGHQLLETFPRLDGHFSRRRLIRRSLTPDGRLDVYPLSLRGAARELGILGGVQATLDLAVAKYRHRRCDTLPSFVRYYLGDSLYRRSGLKDYIERFYGASEDQIDLEFATQRLHQLRDGCALRAALPRLLARRRPDPWRTWVARVRPREGFDFVYRLVREDLEASGVSVLLDAGIRSIERLGQGFEVDLGGERRVYDRLVSTIPIPTVLHYLGVAPGDECPVECLRLISLFYRFRGDPKHDAAILYNFTHSGLWKRLTHHSHVYGQVDGEHYFVVEATQNVGDSSLPEDYAIDFESHVRALGLFRGRFDLRGSLITEDAYPIYRLGAAKKIRELKESLHGYGIETVGRQGRFEYLSSAQVATRSAELAGRLASSLP